MPWHLSGIEFPVRRRGNYKSPGGSQPNVSCTHPNSIRQSCHARRPRNEFDWNGRESACFTKISACMEGRSNEASTHDRIQNKWPKEANNSHGQSLTVGSDMVLASLLLYLLNLLGGGGGDLLGHSLWTSALDAEVDRIRSSKWLTSRLLLLRRSASESP